jgi:hypothetical protein
VSGKKIEVVLDDEARARGQITPDQRFLLKRVAHREAAGKVPNTYRGAVLDLLRDWQRLGMTLDRAVDELERFLWRPDPKGEKSHRRREKVQDLRSLLEIWEFKYRQEGGQRPRSWAKNEIAKHFGYANGEALRKALQANRVNPKSRRKPRG